MEFDWLDMWKDFYQSNFFMPSLVVVVAILAIILRQIKWTSKERRYILDLQVHALQVKKSM